MLRALRHNAQRGGVSTTLVVVSGASRLRCSICQWSMGASSRWLC
ncbi:MAG: hypothetical protein EVA65_01430 [Oceanococcus sp.]|nr:MAG: hypothetical protein EVA65_01430 [Oceanococcus sp.]